MWAIIHHLTRRTFYDLNYHGYPGGLNDDPKWNKSHRRTNITWYHLYEESKTVKSQKLRLEWSFLGPGGVGNGDMLVKVNKVSVTQDE